MKNCPNLDGMMNLVVIPTNSQKQIVEVQDSDIYLAKKAKLRKLFSKEKAALSQLAYVTSMELKLAPDSLIDLGKSEFKKLTSSFTPDFLETIENGRLNLLFVLNGESDHGPALESHIGLAAHVKKRGGFTAALGGDHLKDDVAKIFMEMAPGNRYLSRETKFEFKLSENVSIPEFIHYEDFSNQDLTDEDADLEFELSEGGCDINEVQRKREEQINWFRERLLDSKGHLDDPLREVIDNIPVTPPGPKDKTNRHPIRFFGKEAIKRGWARESIHPIKTASRLTGVEVENLPLNVRNALIIQTFSKSGVLSSI